MPFDKGTLTLPAGTRFEEHTIVAPGDVIVADGCTLGYAVKAGGRALVGETCTLGGIAAAGDVHVDHFSRVEGDVVTEAAAFLGEKVVVKGKLKARDLDVGDSVSIEGGFDAKGWVSIRNPIPAVMYIFLYLLQLVGQGRSDEVERILQELEKEQDAPIVVGQGYLYVPAGSALGLQEGSVKGNLSVGPNSRVLANLDVKGWARVEEHALLVGALRAAQDIHLGHAAQVEGDLETQGTLHLGAEARVAGSIEARRVVMHQTAKVEGTVQAREGISFVSEASEAMVQKVEDLASGHVEVQGLLH